jgi:hexosaminidase
MNLQPTHGVVPAPVVHRNRPGEPFGLAGATVVLTDDALEDVARVFVTDLAADVGVTLSVATERPAAGATLELALEASGATGLGDAAGRGRPLGVSPTRRPEDERYHLSASDGRVTVTAGQPVGVHRGLSTLRQLLHAARRPDGAVVFEPVEAFDGPRFAWRGLTVDVARTFLPVERLLRVVDMLSLYKLNVLHLHLTDDAGWRIEIRSRPRLTEVGGAGALGDRPGGWYTQDEYRRLVAYAQERFVTVVPEVDMPGHVIAALRSYPELAADGVAPQAPTGAGISTHALRLDVPGPAEFVADVVREVAALTPGPRVHRGGDEVLGMPSQAYTAFVTEAARLVREAGKQPVAWQEATRAGLDGSALVQYWFDRTDELAGGDGVDPGALGIPPETLAAITAMFAEADGDVARAREHGTRVLLSPTRHAYLDVPYAEPGTDELSEARRARLGLPTYPRMTSHDFWEWDPETLLAPQLPPEALAGVGGAVWAETVQDADDLEFLLLPRLPGLAERAWARHADVTWDQHSARLAGHGRLWDRRGWTWFRSRLIPWS